MKSPIAIIGIGGRFPGAHGPEAFWRMLRDGVDAIGEVPPGRWDFDSVYDAKPGTPGKLYTRAGGFLEDVDQFDASFFGVSPREAVAMDPQQRLLMESAWEALEDGGQVPGALAGTRTGCFIGALYNDYEDMLIGNHKAYDVYAYAGGMRSSMAGRICHALGLQGPSMVIDTACSSSLVAVHLACQALWNDECALALAGGTNLMLLPVYSMGYSSAKMLAEDGRCKAFDARANGTIRSEAVAVIALKRLDDAVAAEDPIYAVIRGTAVNHDGQNSPWMQPSRDGQGALLREVYAKAGIDPSRVHYVEAHGTGTKVGDPIEVNALADVMGAGRSADRPLLVGSVKSNIGHTEGAAGITALIKVALALKHKAIPPSLHFDEPNPAIPWERVKVPTELTPWTRGSEPVIAGVNSFGITGINAHAVLEEAPVRLALVEDAGTMLLPLSAQTPAALAALVKAHLAAGDARVLTDVVHTAAVRRTHHAHRLSLVFNTREDLAEHLAAFEDGAIQSGLCTAGKAPAQRRKVVFVFSGQGSQWAGMGRELFADEPVFRDELVRWDDAMRPYNDWSLLDELVADEAHSRLDKIDVVQPSIVAVQAALAALWRSWGIEPDAVVGHSLGEVTAAHVAGVLSLEDAARVICRRSHLFKQLEGTGRMLAVDMPLDKATALAAEYGGAISIACSNSPRSTVLSGDAAPLDEVLARLQAQNVFARVVKVSFAAHSHHLEPFKAECLAALEGLAPKPAQIPFRSSVIRGLGAKPEDGLALNADYWWRNMRGTVLYAEAAADLMESGHDLFLEVAPHPILSVPTTQCFKHGNVEGTILPSIRRGEPERAVLLGSLGALYSAGHPVDWARTPSAKGRATPLPSYPFQRERFWIEDAPATRSRATGHALLPVPTVSAVDGSSIWELDLAKDTLPYLVDHGVQGAVVFPAASTLELALSAARCGALADVRFKKALFLDEPKHVQLALSPNGAFRFFARADDAWTELASGTVADAHDSAYVGVHTGAQFEAGTPLAQTSTASLVDGFYATLSARGHDYGPAFQVVESVRRDNGRALGRLVLPADVDTSGHRFHPVLLDGALQVAIAALDEGAALLPVGIERLVVHASGDVRSSWCHATVRPGDGLALDIALVDDAGAIVAELVGVTFRRLDVSRTSEVTSVLHEARWIPAPGGGAGAPLSGTDGAPAGTWLLVGGPRATADAVGELLRARGERVALVDERELHDLGLVQRAFAAALGAEPCRGVVHLAALSALESVAVDEPRASLAALHVCQAAAALAGPPRVTLVTSRTQPVRDGEPVSVAGATLWGLGAVLRYEHPELSTTLIDVAGLARPGDAPALVRELVTPTLEDRVALRDGGRFVPRLSRVDAPVDGAIEDGRVHAPGATAALDAADGDGERALDPTQPFRVDLTSFGSPDGLHLRGVGRRTPGLGQVEIAVDSAGLNFHDVMLTMGLVPPMWKDGPLDLGWECAGTVSAVGPGVGHLRVGDEVVAIAPPCFAAFAIADASVVHKKPRAMSFADAATIPLAFLTAHHALETKGRLQRGERVLIHAATGGVGLAALQIAQSVGAEVFATAGSDDKRAYLRSLGVKHVFDSRSLAFAGEIMAATNGEGVDVVLNSLSGAAIEKSLSVLRANGRFLELGRRDFLANAGMGLGFFENNRSFFGIDLSALAIHHPAVTGALFRDVMSRFEDGTYRPLPRESFPLARIADAFRHMAQAKHRGKVVIAIHDRTDAVVTTTDPVREDATYLVTGGLGGLGLTVADWLVAQGARSLVLLGRAAPSPAALAALALLRAKGARIDTIAVDVADRAALAAALDRVRSTMPPLRGVFHAAGVLEDGLLRTADDARFLAVFPSKVAGAWHLHELTARDPIEHFVLFSSFVSVLGSPGQGNYAAANAFLDALAHHRRGVGLPALAINWSPWSEVGLAARADRGDRLAGLGVGSLTPTRGVAVLDALVRSPRGAQVVAMPFDVSRWTEHHAAITAAPLYATLKDEAAQVARTGSAAAASGKLGLTRATLVDAPSPADRTALLHGYLDGKIRKALRLGSSKSIDSEAPLKGLGIDSLMALELTHVLAADLALDAPVVKILAGASLAELADHLLHQLAEPPRIAAS